MDNIITFNNEYGEVQCEFLDLIEWNDGEYVVLWPVDNDPDEVGEVVILELESTDEEEEVEYFAAVTDEAVLCAVYEIFKARNEDKYSFEEEGFVDDTVYGLKED